MLALEKLIILPPVVSINIASDRDVIIARDTARRVAMLVGFSPLYQARYGTVTAELCRLVLKTQQAHRFDFHGVQIDEMYGVQIGSPVQWLTGQPYERVQRALRQKLGDLIDEIILEDSSDAPYIRLIIWQHNQEVDDDE